MLNRYTLFLLLAVSTINVFAADVLKIDPDTQGVIVLEDSPAVLNLLTELNEGTHLTITASSDIKSSIVIDKGTYTLDSVIRVLDSQYSTIKGFDSNGMLKSIGVLPLGKPAIASTLKPVRELLEARSQTPAAIKATPSGLDTQEVPEHIDIHNMTREDWRSLSSQEAAIVKRKLVEHRNDEVRKREKAERQKADREFMNSLEEVRKSNPEFYEVLLDRHKKRIQRIRAESDD